MSEDATPEIDIEGFVAARGRALLVDVREPDECVRGHLPGAVHIPRGQFANRVGESDTTTPVFVICTSGNRTSGVTDLLRTGGFDAVSVADAPAPGNALGHPLEGGLA